MYIYSLLCLIDFMYYNFCIIFQQEKMYIGVHMAMKQAEHYMMTVNSVHQLKQEVYEYVKRFHNARKIKSTIRNRSKLIPTSTTQLVSTDYAGPFKIKVLGNRYIIVIVYCFGKYLVSLPVPDKETTTASRALLEHFRVYLE